MIVAPFSIAWLIKFSPLDLFPFIVTYHSPFGRAVFGKKVGENFTLNIKEKEIEFTVQSIEKVS